MSVNMTIGSGEGFVGNLLPIKSNRAPTIICNFLFYSSGLCNWVG